jgi:alpha-N-arabinofuranosidase
VNRDREHAVRLTVDLGLPLATNVVRVEQLHTDDPLAMNTLSDPERVTPRTEETKLDEDLALELPASSYSIVEFTLALPIVPA